MLAVTRTEYGSPGVLHVAEIEKPIPKSKELLIKVEATTVNRTDIGILRGKPYLIRMFTGLISPSSLVTGTDFAGVVEAVGDSVENFSVGDRVWGLNDEGLESQAQFMKIKENSAIDKIPYGFSYEEIVACAEGAHYAFNILQKVKLEAGDKVLLNGATGAIGSALLQLLKYHGAIVTAVGNTANIDLVKSLGADKTYDYLTEDFTLDEEKYDFVFDAVGKSEFRKCKPLMKDKAVYISSELGPGAENLYLPVLTLFSEKRVIFPIPNNRKRTISFMTDLVSNGDFKPVIDRSYNIQEIKEAYEYVASGRKTGNVIIRYW